MSTLQVGGEISYATAVAWMRAWRGLSDAAKGTAMSGSKAMLIPNNDVTALLAETGAAGLRVYYGYGSSGEGDPVRFRFIVVATKGTGADETDILTGTKPNYTGIYDFCVPCPNTCDAASPMNNLPT